jgi:hypothetical protein
MPFAQIQQKITLTGTNQYFDVQLDQIWHWLPYVVEILSLKNWKGAPFQFLSLQRLGLSIIPPGSTRHC